MAGSVYVKREIIKLTPALMGDNYVMTVTSLEDGYDETVTISLTREQLGELLEILYKELNEE